jgi:predicted transposase YdaD
MAIGCREGETKNTVGRYDDTMKTLVGQNPQAIISFLLEGAVYERDVDRELKARTVNADTLYYVRWCDEQIVLHIEFQVKRQKKMPRRIWEYNAQADLVTGKPVYSVVIYLVKRRSIPEPIYTRRLPNGQVVQSCSFRQIKLWEIPPNAFEQPGLEGLLPLLPLTQDGKNFATIDRMIRDLHAVGRQDLLWLGEAVAGLVFTKDTDKQRVKERFSTMLHDILKDSWVYQERMKQVTEMGMKQGLEKGMEQGMEQGLEKGMEQGLEKGMEQGLEKGMKQGLERVIIRFVEIHFPTLLAQVKPAIEQKTSQQLEKMLDEISRASTIEEAQEALVANE